MKEVELPILMLLSAFLCDLAFSCGQQVVTAIFAALTFFTAAIVVDRLRRLYLS